MCERERERLKQKEGGERAIGMGEAKKMKRQTKEECNRPFFG